MKPHIKPIPEWGAGWYACRALGTTGTGRSPMQAYRDWVTAMRLAIHKRQFTAEPWVVL